MVAVYFVCTKQKGKTYRKSPFIKPCNNNNKPCNNNSNVPIGLTVCQESF